MCFMNNLECEAYCFVIGTKNTAQVLEFYQSVQFLFGGNF